MIQYLKTNHPEDAVKELVRMWKYGMMVALTVLCAGIYMLFLLPTKSITIIPGVTEIRPASLLPVIFGLLFGPAGAWGSAIGNLGGDLFGTLSPGSAFGFIGNFLYAYIPYKLWYHIKQRHGEDRAPTINSPWKLARFGITSFIASTACAVTIAWGLDILNLASFSALAIIITLNNTVTTLVLGPVLLPVVYSFAKKNNLLWTDIMHPMDISRPSSDKVYPYMIGSGALGGLISGLAASCLIAGQTIFGHQIPTAGTGNPAVALIVLPFLVMLIYGSLNS
jgi:energy-coupling factor transport system substrate-specific component